MQLPIFITGNAHKSRELCLHLGIELAHAHADTVEIQSLDLMEVVAHKAKTAFVNLGGDTPVLVEDVGLTFAALGRLPGPFCKYFLQELGNDGLCRLLNDYPTRAARATVFFAYYDGHDLTTFTGSCEGEIVDAPRGDAGFGWDPIFIPTGESQTWAEMSAAEQKRTSFRALALAQLQTFLAP